MKKLILGLFAGAALIACQQNEAADGDFTGNETVYALQAGSTYNISGTATFKEKKDGTAFITLALSGTEGKAEFPVHVHLGDISAPGADVTAQLNPILGSSGKSETSLKQLADESPITYQQLVNLTACIKVHLAASGPDRDIILAAGNIGQAAANAPTNGRLGIGVCKSE